MAHPNVYRNEATEQEWMDYATTRHGDTDNWSLRILSGNVFQPCCNGNDTDPVNLEYAKALVSRFSIVLDIECLDEGMQALASILDIQIDGLLDSNNNKVLRPPTKDRIPYPNVYEFLKERNALDVELYEWSKHRSLVNCSALGR
jgi:hypothetical protein